MHSSLISAHQLRELLMSDQSIVVLYTSYSRSGVASKPQIVLDRPNSFIPKSIYFDLAGEFSDQSAAFPTAMPTADNFAKKISKLGINNQSNLVIYDDYGNFCASRVWFMFKSIGHEKVKVLDGGLPAWLNANFPLSNKLEIPSQTIEAYMVNSSDSFKFIDADLVKENIDSKKANTLDARNIERFIGFENEQKQMVGGHIPGSQSCHYQTLLDSNGMFLPKGELHEVMQPMMSEKMIFSCGSGVTACILAHAAYMLGATDLNVYDGSWSQWGTNKGFPISFGEE